MISKPFKKPLVSIDTEQINENFSYGGEKGKKVFQLNEFSEEYREITELASLCLKYMSNFFFLYLLNNLNNKRGN